MPLPGLPQPWTLHHLLAPMALAGLAALMVGCAADEGSDPAPEVDGEATLEPPADELGADPIGSTRPAGDLGEDPGSDDASYSDVDGPFLLELGAVDGGLALDVQLARVLVHVDGDVVALAVDDTWIGVTEGEGRWTGALEATLPEGLIEQLEVTLAPDARIDGELLPIPSAWRDLFLDVSFESGEGMPLVVMTGLIDTAVEDGEVQPWLAQTVLREVDEDGTAGPYGASSR